MTLRIRQFVAGRSQCCAIAALAAALISVNGTAADTRLPDNGFDYGDALYYAYQDRHFQALTDLMVAQKFDRLSQHSDEAELLRGGLLLSYGMQGEASEIFERLLAAKTSPELRNRTWYYMARLRYQRGQVAEAEEAIDQVGRGLPDDLEEDRALLQSQLRIARGDYRGAADILEHMSRWGSAVALYARHNLGVALVKSGDKERGVALLDEVGTAEVDSEELLALRDKANVALGYAALQEKDTERARKYLERVHLKGLFANKALLGFGWALLSTNQIKEALVPWHELAQRPGADPSILEAKLALPYALGQLGANAEALDRYNEAIAVFQRESTNLDESVIAIRRGDLLEALLAANPGEETDRFLAIDHLPQLPHAGHLAQVMAENEFQEAFKYYRQLRFLAANLKNWESRMDAFRGMLDKRRQALASHQFQGRSPERRGSLDELTARRQEISAEIARIEADDDFQALSNADERRIAARLEAMRTATSTRRMTPAAADAARERLRRLSGALIWQQALAFGTRLEEARTNLEEVGITMATATSSNAKLEAARQGVETRLDDFDRRIDALTRRLRDFEQRVDGLAWRQKDYAQELAVAALERQKERIATYLVQARLAVAQIYDRAQRGKEGAGHAVAK